MFDDIVKAVTIQINSKDMTQGVWSKLGVNTKSLSASIVTLNQAWQLTTGVMSAVADGAKLVIDGFVKIGTETKQLLTDGGNFNEQFGQFARLAQNKGLQPDKLILDIQNITSNTTDLSKTISVASKAISAGFSERQMNLAFTYAKKFSESTGESFDAVANKIVQAMATGRKTTLQTLGIIVEKGGDAQEAFKALEKALGNFGNAGFNAADKFISVNNSLDEFYKKTAQAANAAPTLQNMLDNMATSVFNFVKNFDYSKFETFFEFAAIHVQAITGGIDGLVEKAVYGVAKLKTFIEYANYLNPAEALAGAFGQSNVTGAADRNDQWAKETVQAYNDLIQETEQGQTEEEAIRLAQEAQRRMQQDSEEVVSMVTSSSKTKAEKASKEITAITKGQEELTKTLNDLLQSGNEMSGLNALAILLIKQAGKLAQAEGVQVLGV
jgi:hypothetical protein